MPCICSSYMAAHKNKKKQLHEIFLLLFTLFITLAVVPKRGKEWRDPTRRLSARATQLRRIVAAGTNRWL